MSDSRISGALLLVLSTLAFHASTRELLPAVSVFPALLLFAIGAVQLLRGQRRAAQRDRPTASVAKGAAERSISSARHDLALAERRATRSGVSHQALTPEVASFPSPAQPPIQAMRARAGSPPAPTAESVLPEIELEHATCESEPGSEKEDEDAGFLVSGDVSFPIEIQRGDALADQLRKLSLLLEQGVLSEAEYALAKARLLS